MAFASMADAEYKLGVVLSKKLTAFTVLQLINYIENMAHVVPEDRKTDKFFLKKWQLIWLSLEGTTYVHLI